MIDVESWMRQAVALLQRHFGQRLLFVGLQGSHQRGEAREDSDIDILTIMDRLDVADLTAYRGILRNLPQGEKAGGFTCGREELGGWPPSEIFSFAMDTDAYYGSLDGLLPKVTRQDTVMGARMAVSGLYHCTTHLYLSADEAARADGSKELLKSVFFALRLVQYLRTGHYAKTKQELLTVLMDKEAELLRLGMDPVFYGKRWQSDPDALFELLLDWTGKTMGELA